MLDEVWLKWKNQIIETINSIQITTEPFCHFFIEQFLPDEMYQRMDDFWLDNQCFWGQSDISENPLGHDLANLKRVVIIEDAAGFSQSPEAHEFWTQFNLVFNDEGVINALLQKTLVNIMGDRRDLESPPTEGCASTLLVVDDNNFSIDPHVDSQHALLSLLLYLPYPYDAQDIGTSIFEPLEKTMINDPRISKEFTTLIHKNIDFKEVYRAPFRRNSIFGIVNGPKAFHGVKKLEDLKSGRRSILWTISSKEHGTRTYPSALERIKRGITPEIIRENRKKEQLKSRLEDFLAAKQNF